MLATVFIMERIIEQLKEQREKVKETFIKNCLIRRASPPDSPVPDTDSYLDEIYNLNQAISILENHGACKSVVNGG
jgi:hypothetical protein